MADEDVSKLEKKYLLWMASIVAFEKKDISYEDEMAIKDLFHKVINPTSVQIPDSLKLLEKEIRLYAQIIRLSRFVHEHAIEMVPIIKKFQNYGEDEFIKYYNNYRKENV